MEQSRLDTCRDFLNYSHAAGRTCNEEHYHLFPSTFRTMTLYMCRASKIAKKHVAELHSSWSQRKTLALNEQLKVQRTRLNESIAQRAKAWFREPDSKSQQAQRAYGICSRGTKRFRESTYRVHKD